jgi:hypothetical protein
MILFPLVIFLYYLKAKLPLSYRIVVGLQGLSLLIHSHNIYLFFDNIFGLRLLAKSHGFYNFSSRLDTLSINYAIGPFVLLGCFLVVYLCGYHLTETFRKKYKTYTDYLTDNAIHLGNSFYFFGSRMMFFFIGAWISSFSLEIGVLIPAIIFCVAVVAVLSKLFYDFHKNKLE